MSKQIIFIYIILIAFFFIFLSKIPNKKEVEDLKNKITKVEFFQEATRIRDNIVGFKQVNASLANDNERIKNCNDSVDLLSEWSTDIKKVGEDFSVFLQSNQDANNYFNSISKLYDSIVAECNNMSKK
jgi:hypothetical protein